MQIGYYDGTSESAFFQDFGERQFPRYYKKWLIGASDFLNRLALVSEL